MTNKNPKPARNTKPAKTQKEKDDEAIVAANIATIAANTATIITIINS